MGFEGVFSDWSDLHTHTHTHTYRYFHGVCPVQVCGEEKRVHTTCGGATSEHSRSSTRVDFLSGDGRCRNFPGTSDFHVLKFQSCDDEQCDEVSFPTSYFQETAVKWVHYVGAFLFFFFGIVYTILQTVMSYQACPIGSSIGICRARLFFAIVATVAFFPSILPLKWHLCSPSMDLVPHFLSWSFSCHLCSPCEKNLIAHTHRWSGMFQFLSPGSNKYIAK